MSSTRPIWLTREQAAWFGVLYNGLPFKKRTALDGPGQALIDAVAAFEEAPADAEQAAMEALADEAGYDTDGDWLPELEARHVLRALGRPDE